MMKQMTSGAEDWLYVYTADEERVWQFKLGSAPAFHRYTLRDLSGQVLREYTSTGDFWEVKRDYVYREGQLLAAMTQAGVRHFHLDHLGTPRLITNANGQREAYHVYYPFGEEATDPFQDQERMKFTGHERDLANPDGTGDDLDYMHARILSPLSGRFLSTDPKISLRRTMKRPQAWNRFAYVVNNPLKYIDPAGEVFKLASCGESGDADQCAAQSQILRNALGDIASQIRINTDGTVSLAKGVSASQFVAGGDFPKGLLMLIADRHTFSLVTGSGKGELTGGGSFEPGKKGGGTIYLEPAMFPRQTGDVIATVEIALVHEAGHALRQLFPDYFDSINATLIGRDIILGIKGEGYAVNFENRFRRNIGADIRYSYDSSLLDVIVDFGVDLFPNED